MATTMHERIAEEHLRNFMAGAEGQRWLRIAEDWRRDRKNATALAVFGQPYKGWDLTQTAALDLLLWAYTAERLTMACIEVGATPSLDRLRDENRRKLANLPFGITVEVYDGTSHDGDGHLLLPDDLIIRDEDGAEVHEAHPWRSVPLEIGHTDASRTWMHIVEYGALARWPYNLDRIYILRTTPPMALTPGEGIPLPNGWCSHQARAAASA